MTPKIYVRALVPSYVKRVEWDNRAGEYAPWIVGARDEKMLENEKLDKLYEEFTLSRDFSEFVDFLEGRGYIVFTVQTPGVWSPKDRVWI